MIDGPTTTTTTHDRTLLVNEQSCPHTTITLYEQFKDASDMYGELLADDLQKTNRGDLFVKRGDNIA